MQKLLILSLTLAWGCSKSGFTSSTPHRNSDNANQERPNGGSDDEADANKNGDDGDDGNSGKTDDDSDLDLDEDDADEDVVVDGTDDSTKPEGFISSENGEKVIRADYTACIALPAAGKRGYGKCEDNLVVVIVNDGKAKEMTCCPLGGKNILSSKREDLHIQRTGTCQANEVLTGMLDPHAPSGFCSKINDKYLKLSSPVPSQYVKGNAPGVMGQIAKSYNVSDTCICPEGTISIGGHTSQDNKCSERCVEIEAKK